MGGVKTLVFAYGHLKCWLFSVDEIGEAGTLSLTSWMSLIDMIEPWAPLLFPTISDWLYFLSRSYGSNETSDILLVESRGFAFSPKDIAPIDLSILKSVVTLTISWMPSGAYLISVYWRGSYPSWLDTSFASMFPSVARKFPEAHESWTDSLF